MKNRKLIKRRRTSLDFNKSAYHVLQEVIKISEEPNDQQRLNKNLYSTGDPVSLEEFNEAIKKIVTKP